MYLFAFIIGAVVGSFLNVCISRIPRGESLWHPPSHCPKCGSPLAWYDNIPLISYGLLRGRCRRCKAPISLRYPLVELITAVGALISWVKFGPGGPALVAFIFFSCLVCLSFIDLEHQILPHVITLPAIPLFFAAAVLVMGVKFTDAIIGLMGGIASLYLVAVYYEAITGKEGMGGGDVNLAGLLGSFFGWQGLPFILFLAAFMGALVGLSLILFKGHHLKHAIPFGPFLSLGALFYLFFRQEIWGFLLTI